MIPEFRNSGLLPVGVHETTIVELEKVFAKTIQRRKLFNGLLVLIEDLKTMGCKAIYIDGSFVTNKRLPNDIDVCWEDEGIDIDKVEIDFPILFDLDPPRAAQKSKYCCDVFPSCFQANSFKIYRDFFQIDKESNAVKGILKIEL